MRYTILLISIFTLSFTNAQNLPDNLNNYKYVIIDYKVYPNGNKDIYEIGNLLYNELKSYGFTILMENQNLSSDFKDNPCLAVVCTYDETFSSSKGNSVTFTFKNCKDEVVYLNKETRFISDNSSTYYQYTAKSALRPIKKIDYKYNDRFVNPQFWTIDTDFKATLRKLKFVP